MAHLKKIKPSSLLISCFVFLCTWSYTIAQPTFAVANKEGATLLMKTTLAVVAKQKDPRTLKRLANKPSELQEYNNAIDDTNELIRATVKSEWTISKEVQFITEKQADSLEKAKSPWYLLKTTDIKNSGIGTSSFSYNSYVMSNPNATAAQINMARVRAYHYSDLGTTAALAIVPAAQPNNELAMSYLPVVGMSKGSISFMIRHLQNQINDCQRGITSVGSLKDDIEKRQGLLKEKTLLVFDPLISKPLQRQIDKGDLKKFYSNPIKVVPYSEADEIIASKNDKYAFIWVVPAAAVHGQERFYYYIIDGGDSRILYYTQIAGLGANGEFHQAQLLLAGKKSKK